MAITVDYRALLKSLKVHIIRFDTNGLKFVPSQLTKFP